MSEQYFYTFSFVVCPCFHFLCALHFSSLRSSLLSQVGLLPKFPVFLNNGLNKQCMLISRKLALGSELSETGGGGGRGGRQCAANLFSKEGNKFQLSSSVDENSVVFSRLGCYPGSCIQLMWLFKWSDFVYGSVVVWLNMGSIFRVASHAMILFW